MARNRNSSRNKKTLQEEVAGLGIALAQLRVDLFTALAPAELTNRLAPAAYTCRVGELSVDHLGSWIIVSNTPHPNDSIAGRLVGLRPGPPTNNQSGKPTRTLVLQQGSEQAAIFTPTDSIALLAPQSWN